MDNYLVIQRKNFFVKIFVFRGWALKDFWQKCLTKLTEVLGPEVVVKWIKPLEPVGFSDDDSTIILAAPTHLKMNWVRDFYADTIRDVILELLNVKVKVEIVLNSQSQQLQHHEDIHDKSETTSVEVGGNIATKKSDFKENQSDPDQTIVMEFEEDDSDTSEASPSAHFEQTRIQPALNTADRYSYTGAVYVPEEMRKFYESTKLIPRYTFDNLVVGDSNQLAFVTAKNVVRHVGRHGYNPLFIYGKTGLGKTHLMHAIGNELFSRQNMKNVLYMHAETYYTEITQRMIKGTWIEYRAQDSKYVNLDLLLMDDVQLLARKERTQQEFFVLYEALVNMDKQVVISCDTFPDDLNQIEERLISRFKKGIVIEIEPPDIEHRVSILQHKAKDCPNFVLSNEVALYIANYIKSNVRELEGALQKVIAYCDFKKITEPSVEICKDALRDVLRQINSRLTVENIQRIVADYYKIRISDIYSKSRKAPLVNARHVAMYLSKELTRKSYPELGQSFGGRDHSTIHHAVEKIASSRKEDRVLNHDIRILEQILKS